MYLHWCSAVYFNPAKTVGGMIEADLFCLFGLVYAAAVCLISMSMFWFLEVRPGWEWMADSVAILWIGLSMSILAWMKVWMVRVQLIMCQFLTSNETALGQSILQYSMQYDCHHNIRCVSSSTLISLPGRLLLAYGCLASSKKVALSLFFRFRGL